MGKPKLSLGRPPKRPASWLTPDQQDTLTAHLEQHLTAAEAKLISQAIDDGLAATGAGDTLEAVEAAKARRNRSGEIADLVAALRRKLRAEAAEDGFLCVNAEADRELERVRQLALRIAAGPTEAKAGRPILAWRDKLIALVQSHYPAEKLTVTSSSHFVNTIGVLLTFLGEEFDQVDLLKQVKRVLNRKPTSPVIVQLL